MFFEQNRVMPTIAWARFILRFLPADHPVRARLPWLQEDARVAFQIMDRHLAGRATFAAGRYTIADIALYGYAHTADEGGVETADLLNLTRWFSTVRAQPCHVPLEEPARLPA